MKIGQYLKEFRDITDMSQRELAKRCNVSNSFISMLEKDVNPHTNKPIDLSISKYQQIAAGTGVSLRHLFAILGEDTPDKFKELLPKPMIKETKISIDPNERMKNDNVHIILSGLNKMSIEQIERVKAVLLAMYPDIYDEVKK